MWSSADFILDSFCSQHLISTSSVFQKTDYYAIFNKF